MKAYPILRTVIITHFLLSCAVKNGTDPTARNTEQQLRDQSRNHADAETKDDLETFMTFYDDRVISMPEYQVALQGSGEVRSFYKEIFNRQDVKMFQRNPQEFIHMDNTVVEIGTFVKEYTDKIDGTPTRLNGKYWNVWEVKQNGSFKIKGEAYGYFHAVSDPATLVVSRRNIQPDESALTTKSIPFELKAYNALMEKGVRNRDGLLRSEFFADDASFFPFADSTVTGIENLRRYLVAYSQGDVSIDSIMCYTYDFEHHDEFIIEYDMFKVSWRIPQVTAGRTEGKGIRIWKRQADHSLKLFREIGTHNHIQ